MKSSHLFVAALAVATILASPALFHAASGVNSTQIENVVHNYLVKNPEVIVEALQAYQQKQMREMQKTIQKIQEMAPRFATSIFNEAGDPVAGNVNGSVTLVEFFDYQCSHCVGMMPIIDNLIKANPNLRVVFKDFPVLGDLSLVAAKAALAANKQGKYLEFHDALMRHGARLNEETIYTEAKAVGLNVDQLKKDMKSKEIIGQLNVNYKLGQNMGLMGTPAFFIAKTNVTNNAPASAIGFIPGQADQGQLQNLIDKIAK